MPWGANPTSRAGIYWSATIYGSSPDLMSDVEAFFYGLGATGLEWEDGRPAHAPFTDIAMPPAAPFVRAYFPSDDVWIERRRQLHARFGDAVEFTKLRAEDWENSWKQYYVPVPVGDWMIMPAWYPDSPKSTDRTIWLDPGMAFGTGTHPTTRMCLARVVSAMPTGARVMDLGSGSGVLAIAAAKAGAGHVVAVEPDPVAVAVLLENLERNQVMHQVDVVSGTLQDVEPSIPFDLIVANLIAEIIVAEWPRLLRYVTPQSQIILSGIVEERLAEVKQVLDQQGGIIRGESHQEGWVVLEVSPR